MLKKMMVLFSMLGLFSCICFASEIANHAVNSEMLDGIHSTDLVNVADVQSITGTKTFSSVTITSAAITDAVITNASVNGVDVKDRFDAIINSTAALQVQITNSSDTLSSYFPDKVAVYASTGNLQLQITNSSSTLQTYFADKDAVALSTAALDGAIVAITSGTFQNYFADKALVTSIQNSTFTVASIEIATHTWSGDNSFTGGLYPIKDATLPTTGFSEGSIFYNSTEKRIYISTETVTSTNSWVVCNP
ncbi:MAG: hypothetical protein M0Q46_06215 [Endomicrobiales bacterium]|nr:hypothetical protein [Endomicrobiales bacterium]